MRFLPLLMVVLTTVPAVAAAPAVPDQLLPRQNMPASIVAFGATRAIAAIEARLTAAVQQDQAWFTALISATPEGEPLPYSPRFGITEAEYDQVLHAQPVLSQTGSTTLKVTADARTVTFGKSAGAELLAGVTVDLVKNVVRTPLGTTTEGKPFDVPDDDTLGPRSGVQWAFLQGSDPSRNVTRAKFTLTHLNRTDEVLLDYQVTVIKDGKAVRNEEVLLTYPATR
ncbi:hypothetical protein [Deinococcus sonorensis]|uniref:Uncharacterized protein n=2 Tax=Deinococcus sonorensis TaxID=309891 RepID=A0AAU7U5G8_9DEIO